MTCTNYKQDQLKFRMAVSETFFLYLSSELMILIVYNQQNA